MEDNTSKVHVGPTGSRFDEALLRPDAGSVPGTALFVINLCTSIAPVTAAGKTIPGLESYRLYQVARSEDGRTRHRLRLGFFISQEEADQALAMVRDSYPTAFTASLSDDDRRFARGFQPDTAASGKRPAPPVTLVEKMIASAAKDAPQQTSYATVPKAATPATVTTAAATSAAPAAVAYTPKPAGAATTTPALKAAASTTVATATAASSPSLPKQTSSEPAARAVPAKAAPVIELALASEPATPNKEPVAAPSAEPFHVGKGVDIPAVLLTLEATPATSAATPIQEPVATSSIAKKSPPANTASPAVQKTPVPTMSKPASPQPMATHAHNATRTVPPIPRSARDPNRPLPELDSTQTIRALTSAELNDDSQEKWFAIQLAVSDQPVNLDAMPHLDIFEAYRLYSVANAGSGKIVHSLRIGFFREQVSAEAVAGYLKTFFASPSVLRISSAEQLRFNDAPLRTPAANARSEAKVVELSQARERANPAIPTVTMEVTAPARPIDPGATGSFNPTASGSFRAASTGSHKALKQAAKSAVAAKRSSIKAASTGKYKALPKKSLNEQLLDEAREVALSESAIRKLPKNDSLLSRLVGKLTK